MKFDLTIQNFIEAKSFIAIVLISGTQPKTIYGEKI